MKKTKEVVKDIMDVDFEDTGKAKVFDDDGYEEGKSKDRETKVAEVKDITTMLELKKMQRTGGNIRKNKKLLNKKISDTMTRKKFNLLKSKQVARVKFTHFVPRPKPRKRPRRHKKSLNKDEKRVFKKYNRQGR